MHNEPANFVLVFQSTQRHQAREHALVLTAMEIDNYIEHKAPLWQVWVPEHLEQQATQQITLYTSENATPYEQPRPFETIDDGWRGVLAYLSVIWLIPTLQYYLNTDLAALGRLHSELVMQGELWRPITALTLHSDLPHIASNSFFGIVFGLLVGRNLGSGLGWLLVLVCGILANTLNALIQHDDFKSIGASTATFACLGLVPAFGWRRGYFKGQGWVRGFAPMFAAIALLAFTGGFGSAKVDIFAHVFGFLFGIGMGLAVAHIKLDKITPADQQRAGVFALTIIGGAWLSAI